MPSSEESQFRTLTFPRIRRTTTAMRDTYTMHVLSFSFSPFLFLSRRPQPTLLVLFFPSRRDKHGARRGVTRRGAPSRPTEPPRDFAKRAAPRARRRHITAVHAGADTPRETLSILRRLEYSRCLSRHARSCAAAAAAAHRDPNLEIRGEEPH